MKPNIADTISYEVKREIAQRYFGFRKLIEEDELELSEKIRQYASILDKRISFDLIRIYILLKDERLILTFLELIGLKESLFYDPYLAESENIRKRVFTGVELRGLTRSSCFRNAVLDCYERLVEHVSRYRENYEELEDLNESIREEIKLFYRKNDLSSILGFLRSLGDSAPGVLLGAPESGLASELEHKLLIAPPTPIAQFLPMMPPLPSLMSIKHKFKEIIKEALLLQDVDIHTYTSVKTQFWRRG